MKCFKNISKILFFFIKCKQNNGYLKHIFTFTNPFSRTLQNDVTASRLSTPFLTVGHRYRKYIIVVVLVVVVVIVIVVVIVVVVVVAVDGVDC